MVNAVRIETPKGGEPVYHLVLSVNDNVVGSVTFKDAVDRNTFLTHYNLLAPLGYGYIEMQIDTENTEEVTDA